MTEFAMLSQEEIAATSPFGGRGVKIDREPKLIPDHMWNPDVLTEALGKVLSGPFSLAVFPQCAWVAWDHPDNTSRHLPALLWRALMSMDVPEPVPQDAYARLRNGKTLSLAEVSDVLRDLAGARQAEIAGDGQ